MLKINNKSQEISDWLESWKFFIFCKNELAFFVILSSLINLPIILHRHSILSHLGQSYIGHFLVELITALFFTIFVYFIFIKIKKIGHFLCFLFLYNCLVINHFVWNYGKILDSGVVADIFENDVGQVSEYIGLWLISKTILFIAIAYGIGKRKFLAKLNLSLKTIAIYFILLISLVSFNDKFYD